MLMNRKHDFVDAFGDAGEAVSYVDADDLRAKVDRYLSNPAYRREVGDALRERIAERFQLKDVLWRVLNAAFECSGTVGSLQKSIQSDQHSDDVMDLLSEIRAEPQWIGASVRHVVGGVLISTPTDAWAYAAAVSIPSSVGAMTEPHLRVRVKVETGRIGLAALVDKTGALLEEQLVSPSSDPAIVTLELPCEGVSAVVLRNSVDYTSRAMVVEVTLCDRLRSSSAAR